MNTSSHINSDYRQQSSSEEQVLYDYLLEQVKTDSPSQLIEDFRYLFVEGRGFRDVQVYAALEKIVKRKNIEYQFNYFFNRCCHILINSWQMQPQLQSAIPELIAIFENLAPARSGFNNTANQIRYLVKNFVQSDQYVKLQRLARVINSKQNTCNSVGNLIDRYPYLYNHCLLSEDSSQEHQQTVRHIKAQTEKRFEVNLSRYVTYKVRLAQVARSPQMSEEEGRIIRPVKNPTLLNDKELNRALKHFVGNVDGGSSYKSLSQNFLTQSVHTQSFQGFKDDLYEYLLSSMDSQYAKGQFNKKIYQILQNTLPECNHQKPSEFLMLRTSSQLLNFLVVESSNKPDHYVFVDMISNMGVTQTMGVLLKVILICNKVKPYLEKRFSILFNHYESFAREGVPWLVKSLENLQLAFSVHFGKVDLSCLNQVKLQ
ncbi:hypothetical protein [Aphanothece sacrum]|uniref:Uncharacterized protein n=1 Tax=Aphanothece sacrum FPU1 TaxID=1920663 RepID=A0A401IMY2_APHSA|nr:hypothetical protein [Aphanothece sacrum]GBF82588.1 hypothetical protein AsFPU1_4018 [Aphanothece sacrum FPU1]GBF84722.1 hypothetical protein AsFPU3_1776 [Aphanothece sacrum FPU3]